VITELDQAVCLHVYDGLSVESEHLDTVLYGEVVYDETHRFTKHERVFTSPLVENNLQQTRFVTLSNRVYCATAPPTQMAITLHEWRWLRRYLFSPTELLAFRDIKDLNRENRPSPDDGC
jgi:hypothetical protein